MSKDDIVSPFPAGMTPTVPYETDKYNIADGWTLTGYVKGTIERLYIRGTITI